MTQRDNRDRVFLLGGYDVVGTRLNMACERRALVVRSDAGVDALDEFTFVSQLAGMMSHDGFYDDAATEILTAMEAAEGAVTPIAMGFEGNTLGADLQCAEEGLQTQIVRLGARGDLHRLSAEHTLSKRIDGCQIVDPLAAIAGDGDSPADLDGGAQSTGGGRLYVFVTALDLDGATSLDFTLQDSASDGGPYANQGAAALSFTAIRGKVREFTGTLERYVSIDHNFIGGTSPTATFLTALVRD